MSNQKAAFESKLEGGDQRAAFEAWITQPPHNHRVDVLTEQSMSPGQYRYYESQLAWEAWQEALKSPEVQALREALEMIAGMRPCPDSLMGNADIALMALEKLK